MEPTFSASLLNTLYLLDSNDRCTHETLKVNNYWVNKSWIYQIIRKSHQGPTFFKNVLVLTQVYIWRGLVPPRNLSNCISPQKVKCCFQRENHQLLLQQKIHFWLCLWKSLYQGSDPDDTVILFHWNQQIFQEILKKILFIILWKKKNKIAYSLLMVDQ